jgi:hypothetical protein
VVQRASKGLNKVPSQGWTRQRTWRAPFMTFAASSTLGTFLLVPHSLNGNSLMIADMAVDSEGQGKRQPPIAPSAHRGRVKASVP